MQSAIGQAAVDEYFEGTNYPTPTGLALHLGIHPADLRSRAEGEEVVELGLYKIIAEAESRLYKNVYGPKAMIQRVELYLPIQTVEDADLVGDIQYVG